MIALSSFFVFFCLFVCLFFWGGVGGGASALELDKKYKLLQKRFIFSHLGASEGRKFLSFRVMYFIDILLT